jgi:hypothetical protein
MATILVGSGIIGYNSERGPLRLSTKIFFSPLTLPGEFLNIFYMNYAFDLTQNIAKPNIMATILVGSGIIGYNSERGPPKHHQSCQV